MAVSVDQFGKALVASGLMTPDEVKALWNALAADIRPKTGDAFAQLLVDRGKLTDFQAKEILEGRGARLVMGDYVILQEIGAGGMGQVYKARHKRMERVVALKVMSAAAMKDEAAVKRFQREVRAAARLEHPNIVTAYDSGEAGAVKYLVMQFVDGGDLSGLVKKTGALEIERAVDYVLQAARGLAFAHGEGVIHRDIKPANLLLDKKGVVKILDMGLARIESSDDGLTATEQVMGTVDYMSPEQAANTKGVDGRADIYSLGCTLWFLLTGKKLYDADTMIARLMAHRDGELPSLVKTRDDAPWPLEQAFHKMIAKRPQDRFQSMDEVVAALSAFGPSGSSTGMGSSIGMGSGPQNAELSAFLKSVGPGGKSQVKPSPSATNVGTEATAQFVSPEVSTDPKSEILPAPPTAAKPRAKVTPSKGKKPPVALIAGGVGGLALLVALGVWVIIKNDKDEVVATIAVPSGGSVVVKNEPSTVAPAVKPVSFADMLDSPDYVWSDPENLGPNVNGPANEQIRGLTNDERRLYFRGKDSAGLDRSYEAVRNTTTEPFGKATLAQPMTTDAYLDGDGLSFVAIERNEKSGHDIVSYRRPSIDAPWGQPVNLGPQINSPGDERRPTLSHDGRTLLYTTYRNGMLTRELRISRRASTADSFGPGTNVGAAAGATVGQLLPDGQTIVFRRDHVLHFTFTGRNGVVSSLPMQKHPFGDEPSEDLNLLFAPDGRTVYFSANRPGGQGGNDIWVTRRVPKASSTTPVPQPLPPTVSTAPPANVVYLDDLPEKSYVGLNNHLYKPGRNAEDAASFAAVFISESPVHTLMMHPPAEKDSPDMTGRLVYDLAAGYTRFQTQFRVRATKRTRPVVAEVWGDGKRLWESGDLVPRKVGGATADVDVAGVRELTLLVRAETDTGNSHTLLIEPRLTPVPSPSPLTPDPSAVVYLDDLPEKDWQGHNELGKHGDKWKKDGSQIDWQGAKPAHALTTYPNRNGSAAVTYVLGKRYSAFQAVIGVTLTPQTPLTFRVSGDGKILWESPPQSKRVYSGVEVNVDLRGIETLKLEVFCPGDNKAAHAVWIDPLLTPIGQAATQAAAPPAAVAPFDAAQARAHQEAWAKHLGVPVEKTVELPGGEKLTLVLVPPGEFLMGSTPEEQAQFPKKPIAGRENPDRSRKMLPEGPPHRVTITRPFYLGKYEVTQAQWQAVLGDSPSHNVGPTLPVERVSWEMIQPFLSKLNENPAAENMTLALPTEAQWEFACRSGTTTPFSLGETEQELREYGWFRENSDLKTHPVGELKPNAFGLYDMHGNVVEWCRDLGDETWYEKSPPSDPIGPPDGSERLLRGGGINELASTCRSAYRSAALPSSHLFNFGFRVAAELDAIPLAAAATPTPPTPPGGAPGAKVVSQVERLTSPDYEWSEPESLGPVVNAAKGTGSPTLSDDQLCLIVPIVGQHEKSDDARNGIQEFRRPTTDAPWGVARKVADGGESYPSLSADGLTLVSVSRKGEDSDQGGDLFIRTRPTRDAGWSSLKPIASLNTKKTELRPVIAPDGLSLVFSSDRPGGQGSNDLWMSRRADLNADWQPPVNLSPKVNTPKREAASQILADGRAILVHQNDGDLFLAAPDAQGVYDLRPVPLPPSVKIKKCWLSPDGATLYFDHSKAGDQEEGTNEIRLIRRVPKTAKSPISDLKSPSITAEALTFAGHRYLLVDAGDKGGVLWDEAKAQAESLGGHLAAINSQAEYDWVRDNIYRKRPRAGGAHVRMFLGAVRPGGDAEWKWDTGDAFDRGLWIGFSRGVTLNDHVLIWVDGLERWIGAARADFAAGYFLVEWDSLALPSSVTTPNRQ